MSQTARRFAILANAAAGDKPRSWLAAKIAGAFSFARRWCLVATGGRTGDAGIPQARMTQAVFAAGVPAPEVFGEVTLDGRFGIVLGRLDGPTLLQLTRSGGLTFAQAGAILASLGLSVHRMSPPPEAFYLRGWMDTAFRGS